MGSGLCFLLAAIYFLWGSQPLHGNPGGDSELPDRSQALDQLLMRVAERSEQRDAALGGYSAMRHYEAENALTGTRAQMRVKVMFRSPGAKDFTILLEQGSKIVRDRVFLPALAAENEALQPDLKRRSDITRENYDFTLIGEEELANRRCFVLEARPLRKDKFLLRSRVWIDASDFAVIRIQGEMVMRPSFWTRKVEFTRDYHKVGDFWLPLRDASVSQLWLFGRSTLTIQYYDYVVEGRTAARNDPLPEVPAGNR